MAFRENPYGSTSLRPPQTALRPVASRQSPSSPQACAAATSLGASAQTASQTDNPQGGRQTARPVAAQERTGPSTVQQRTNPTSGQPGVVQEGSDASDATTHLNRAIAVLHQMERKPEVAAQLAKAKGVFVIPDSVRVAVGVGARGGAGVLLVRRADGWSTPSFYNMAGLTVGAQLGPRAAAWPSSSTTRRR